MPSGRSTTKPTPLLSGTPYVIPSAAPNDMLTVMPTVMPTKNEGRLGYFSRLIEAVDVSSE